MATKAQWVVVFDDKAVIKNFAEGADNGVGYVISDDDFWGLSKWSNIWAIQYGTPNPNDTVLFRSGGDFSDFISRWDAHHLSELQANWDNDNIEGETSEDKIARLGSRPTSYSS
jgi:hypothetical protein